MSAEHEAVPVTDEKREVEKDSGIEKSPGSERHSFHGSHKDSADTPDAVAGPREENPENVYVTGYKLVAIVVALVLASFLMLLDTSIVSTVCNIDTRIHLPVHDVGH